MTISPNLPGQFDFPPGVGLIDGAQLTRLINLLFGFQGGLTALAGGAALGTQLAFAVNSLDTVITNNDSAVLPPATSIGQPCTVINNGAATLALFGYGADKIVASGSVGAGAASVTQLTGVARQYVCSALGLWKQLG